MSQYIVDHPTLSVLVGWDNPLQSFYASVTDPGLILENEESDDAYLLWVGNTYGEIKDVQTLAGLLSPWAEIPTEIADKLGQDMAARTPPTKLQQLMHRLMAD